MSGPSDKAVEAAKRTHPPRVEAMLRAAHDPALGLDRSVCARSVSEWIRRVDRAWLADEFKREFGGES